ncbi:MAG: IclR family transcriptional regulator [Acidobacteriaceae bacterium]
MIAVDEDANVATAGRTEEGQHVRLPAVDRAMNLFEVLGRSPRGLTLSELSRKLCVPKSTVHYLTYTLKTRGYLLQTAEGRYALGLRFATLASMSMVELRLSKLAKPYLRQIADEFDLTVTMTTLRGPESITIATAASSHVGSGGAWIGHHADLHCTAQGKALIAGLSDDELDELFRGREFARYTPKTIRSLSALKAHLVGVRMSGFSINDEELLPGILGVGAPILDFMGATVAAISFRGSSEQIPNSRLPELGREIVRTSRNLSLQIAGCLSPPAE